MYGHVNNTKHGLKCMKCRDSKMYHANVVAIN